MEKLMLSEIQVMHIYGLYRYVYFRMSTNAFLPETQPIANNGAGWKLCIQEIQDLKSRLERIEDCVPGSRRSHRRGIVFSQDSSQQGLCFLLRAPAIVVLHAYRFYGSRKTTGSSFPFRRLFPRKPFARQQSM
jgi:hypothetical protein